MVHINAHTSHRGHPPKKRARIDSDLEESCSVEASASGDFEEEDASASASPSTNQESFSTAQNHALSLLSACNRLNNDPLISFSDRDAILALAAARHPESIGELLQQKYSEAKDHEERNSRIIDFEPYYQEVQTSLSTLPVTRNRVDPSAFQLEGLRMREVFTRVDQIFDLILREIDLESQVKSKGSAARTMQKILRHLLIFVLESDYLFPQEFSSDRGRVGLDGKMLKLIKDKFNHEKHDIKIMCEDPMGESDWALRIEHLVWLSSRAGDKVFKKLEQVLNIVMKDAYDPATDYDSCGMATF